MCHLDESVIGTHYKIVEFKYVRSRPLGYECDDTEYQDVCQANYGMFSSPAGISQDCHELKFESDRFLIRLQVKNPDSQFMNEVIEGLVPKSFVL